MLLTTHYMDEAQRLCSRVAIVDQGKVIALGTPRELIQTLGGTGPEVVEFTCAGPVEAGEDPEGRGNGRQPAPGAWRRATRFDGPRGLRKRKTRWQH